MSDEREQRAVGKQGLWGLVLVVASVVSFWWSVRIWEQSDSSGFSAIYYSHGVSGEAIRGWTQMMALSTGVVGLFILVSAVLRRIPQRWLRHTVGWLSVTCGVLAVPYVGLLFVLALIGSGVTDYSRFEAADGQSVLVTQDGFDGDIVTIYTKYDDTHYVFSQSAESLRGFPRVKDRKCHLDTDDGHLVLTCDTDTVKITAR